MTSTIPAAPCTCLGACPLASTCEEGGPWAISLPDWLAVRIGMGPLAEHVPKPDMAEARKEPAGLAFPGGGATQWPLQRYGRFMPSGTGEPPGLGQDVGAASSPTWKVRPVGRRGRACSTPGKRGKTGASSHTGPSLPPRQEEGTPRDWHDWLARS